MRNRIALFAVAAIFLASCHRSVLIDSEPTGALVRVNGVPRGTTPIRTNLEYTAFTNFEVTLEKEGYRPATARLPMELNPGALICGVMCLPVLLWVQQPASTVFVLERASETPMPVPPPTGGATPIPPPDVTSGATAVATPVR